MRPRSLRTNVKLERETERERTKRKPRPPTTPPTSCSLTHLEDVTPSTARGLTPIVVPPACGARLRRRQAAHNPFHMVLIINHCARLNSTPGTSLGARERGGDDMNAFSVHSPSMPSVLRSFFCLCVFLRYCSCRTHAKCM